MLAGLYQQHKTREIFRIILNALFENHPAIVNSGAPSGDSRIRFVSPCEHFADASSSVFGRDALERWMAGEESFALRQSHGMGRNRVNLFHRSAWTAD